MQQDEPAHPQTRTPSMWERFQDTRRAFGGRPALAFPDRTLTYDQLGESADRIAAALDATASDDEPLIGVFARRSETAYAGFLGALRSGRGYVPMNPTFPPARTQTMLRDSGVRTIVAGQEALPLLADVLEVERDLTILVPHGASPAVPGHTVVSQGEIAAAVPVPHKPPRPTDLAYLLFTSGSTGRPKGVGITQANLDAMVGYLGPAYGIGPEDRISHMYELTFDASVQDLYVTWAAGACLCLPPEGATMAPGRYINDQQLTVWYSVPSVAMIMSRLRALKPGSLPTLRTSMFVGEALPAKLADEWAAAAPASSVVNLYGPTEATVTITAYTWTPGEQADGFVPIGRPYPGHRVAVVDPDGIEVAAGEPGELCLTGPQVAPGYFRDPERTAAAFRTLPGEGETVWYCTGDLVARDPERGLLFRGRIDDQVQIMGFRVELQEIDAALRAAADSALTMAVSHPPGPAAEAVYAFAAETDVDEVTVLERCRERLPHYMVPRRVFLRPDLPMNRNGKLDRKALQAFLEEELG
jgi:amino acid adenylation domain-containing protein